MANNQDNWTDFGYVAPTLLEQIRGFRPIMVIGLYYKDDEGNKMTPTHIWFSCDTRNWHQNAESVHGRAFTTYFGKHGTCLTPVYKRNGEPYRRDDMCDVSAMYDNKFLKDFYRE